MLAMMSTQSPAQTAWMIFWCFLLSMEIGVAILVYYHMMLDFQEKKRVRRALYSPLALAVLVGLLGLMGHATWSVYGKYRDTAANKATAEKQKVSLQARAQSLTADIARLSTDAGKEEEIRTKYGFTKAGEGVIVIVDDTSAKGATSTPVSGWSHFWQMIKSIF